MCSEKALGPRSKLLSRNLPGLHVLVKALRESKWPCKLSPYFFEKKKSIQITAQKGPARSSQLGGGYKYLQQNYILRARKIVNTGKQSESWKAGAGAGEAREDARAEVTAFRLGSNVSTGNSREHFDAGMILIIMPDNDRPIQRPFVYIRIG